MARSRRGRELMRNSGDVCHIAIGCRTLDQAYDFYVLGLGCKLARRYPDRITLDFFGDQLVCHLCQESDLVAIPAFYPRHFGVTFGERSAFENLIRLIKIRNLPFFRAPCTRFQGTAEEHLTFALLDPANNVLEFKHYVDPRMMY